MPNSFLHFRSIDAYIDTATRATSCSSADGSRALADESRAGVSAADGGAHVPPPAFAGGGTRAIALTDTDQFLRRAKLAQPGAAQRNSALAHIMKVEGDVVQAAAHLSGRKTFATEFPGNGFGNTVRTACQILANPTGVAVVRLTLSGFDTHANQPGTQARLLGDLASGLVALKSAMIELGKWDDTLVLTYAEFGRRPKENQNNGTDHGTANVHFALGGRVIGGLYGEQPNLAALGGDGNPAFALDFRRIYATAIDTFWGADSRDALGGRFAPVPFGAA